MKANWFTEIGEFFIKSHTAHCSIENSFRMMMLLYIYICETGYYDSIGISYLHMFRPYFGVH